MMKLLLNSILIIFFVEFFSLKIEKKIKKKKIDLDLTHIFPLKSTMAFMLFFYISHGFIFDFVTSIIIIFIFEKITIYFFRIYLSRIYYFFSFRYKLFFNLADKNYLIFLKRKLGSFYYNIIYNYYARIILYIFLLNIFNFWSYLFFWCLFELLDFVTLTLNNIGNVMLFEINNCNDKIVLTKKGEKKRELYLQSLFLKFQPITYTNFYWSEDYFYLNSYLNELTKEGFY